MNTLFKRLSVSLPHNGGDVDFLIKEPYWVIVTVPYNLYDAEQKKPKTKQNIMKSIWRKNVMENLLPSASYSLLNEPQWFREMSRNQAKNNRIDAVTGFITWIRDVTA